MNNSQPRIRVTRIGGSNEEDERPTPHVPHIMAQRLELAAAMKSMNTQVAFNPGDFVQFRHALGPLKNEARAKLAFIFVNWFDQLSERAVTMHLANREVAEVSATPNPDCLIGHCLSSGGTLIMMVADSRTLELAQGVTDVEAEA